MVALPCDVARSGESAQSAYVTVFKTMVSVLERVVSQAPSTDVEPPLRRSPQCV